MSSTEQKTIFILLCFAYRHEKIVFCIWRHKHYTDTSVRLQSLGSSRLDHLNIEEEYRLSIFSFITSKKITVCRKCLVAILAYTVFLSSNSFLDASSDAKTLCLSSEEMLVFSPLSRRWMMVIRPDLLVSVFPTEFPTVRRNENGAIFSLL